jgi:hypothetical protein
MRFSCKHILYGISVEVYMGRQNSLQIIPCLTRRQVSSLLTLDKVRWMRVCYPSVYCKWTDGITLYVCTSSHH